jgi:serine phosphatase RsbU (regulator of sigma subunit)
LHAPVDFLIAERSAVDVKLYRPRMLVQLRSICGRMGASVARITTECLYCTRPLFAFVVKPVPTYLKLQAHENQVTPPDVEECNGLDAACQAFTAATGWQFEYRDGSAADDADLLWSTPIHPGVGASPGHLRIELGGAQRVADIAARVPLEAAEPLAAAIATLVEQNLSLRRTLWEREAELAAGVPLTLRSDEPQHLAARLEAAIKAGAQMLDCSVGALYTLDEATTQLKLRSSWGLPADRLAQPARPLATALADLEALLGHAVALANTESFRPWNVPEVCQAALCVPVSSPTMPLGTLWFFCDRSRDFTAAQTNLAEVIAGRLATELDRALLLHEQVQAVGVLKQIEAASRQQQHSLATVAPPIEGWEIAGWTAQAAALGGALHEWRALPDGRLAVIVADCGEGGLAGALTAAALRSALCSECDHFRIERDRGRGKQSNDAVAILIRLHELLAAASSGDQWAGAALAVIDAARGEIEIASTGRPTALVLKGDASASLLLPTLPLGLVEPSSIRAIRTTLALAETLVMYTRGFVEAGDEQGRPLDEAALSRILWQSRERTANELIEILCDRQEAHAVRPGELDRSAVVIKRR